MGNITEPFKVKLIIGFLFVHERELVKAKEVLQSKFGDIDKESPIFSFDYTTYYNKEMGENICRQYVSFSKPVYADDTADIKIFTNLLEEKLSLKGKRKINIDPGYVDYSKLILSTTKDATYRVYLKYGIYAQATLFYKDKTFTPWEWTYADYKSEIAIKFFNEVRDCYSEGMHTTVKYFAPYGPHFQIKKFTYNRSVVIFMLFFLLGPFALPWLWHSPKFNKAAKIILTVVVLIYTVILVVPLVGVVLWFIENADAVRRVFISVTQ